MSDSNHLSFILVVAAFTKKEKSKSQERLIEFACESCLFYVSFICGFMKSRNQQHHAYISRISTSKFVYEYDECVYK